MKILKAKQLKEADDITIKRQGISSWELMERAATQLFEWLHNRLQQAPVTLHIFCGTGNNGGDGLAVARLLLEQNYQVKVYVVNFSEQRTPDFLMNYEKLKELKLWPEILKADDALPELPPQDIIVDAIFGQGLNRPAEDWVAAIIQHINASKAFTLAVDVPSGMYMNQVPKEQDVVVQANHTLSFQVAKLPFFLPQTGIFTDTWELLDIGLDAQYLQEVATDMQLIGAMEVLQFYKPRKRFSHKNTYGHVLVIGGSYGKMGAPMLTAEAAMNAGAGLVTAYIPKCGYQIFQTALPEVMVLTSRHEEYISEIEFDLKPTVVAFGPGANTKEVTIRAFRAFLETNTLPLVVDADGLNILAQHQDLLSLLPAKTILTPHPGELKRLIGAWEDDFDKLAKAKAFAAQYDLVLVLKDAYTITVCEGQLYVNTTGNPGMATAGSGDTLTGIIAGLVAQQYDPLQAALFGVYLHGKAGDLSVEKNSYQALTATEIIDFIGDAYLSLFEG